MMNYLNLALLNIIKFVVSTPLLLLIVSFESHAANIDTSNTSQKIKLYLPVESTQFSSLIELLEKDLILNNIDYIQFEDIDHWHAYQQGLRVGRLGFYFAPPHFAAWALSEFSFTPLLRISEPLSYVIAANKVNSEIFEINDLVGKRICTAKPFNLSYLLSSTEFNKQLRSASINIVESVEKQMIDKTSLCDAYSLTNHLFENVSAKTPGRYIRLQQSANFNNYVLIAHPEIDDEQVLAITNYFLRDKTQKLLTPMLKQFSQTSVLVPSKLSDFPAEYSQTLDHYWKK